MIVRVKVCGVRSTANALSCAEAGADWLGLNFHPTSARRVDPAVAAEIVRALRGRAETVGLFVDRDPLEIRRLAESVGFDFVQLHGSEPVESWAELADLRVIKAFRIGSIADIDALAADLDRARTLGASLHAVLVDAHVPGLAGGTGVRIAVDLLDRLPLVERLILAGGLTPENVAEAVARVRPWMVDVAGGVESAPGEKDPERVARFVAEARRASRGATTS
ncbi:MAG: phosphoribosylanthranilate isomerase [Isosphaeraceae bacterium]|nr:phosphoribosylanthranilate isomerase [Isosphaeraceae bacterium]